MFLLRKALLLLAFFVTLLMWVFHERLWLKLRPRYFAELTVPNLVPCKLYSFVIGFLLFVTLKTSHLSGLNCMSQFDPHCCKASRSFCKMLVSSELLIFRYSRQSSANNRAVVCYELCLIFSFCQSIPGRLKSPPNHMCAPLCAKIFAKYVCRLSRYMLSRLSGGR